MNSQKIELKKIRLGLLGDSEVGKTAICNSFNNIKFEPNYIITFGVERLKNSFLLKNGKNIELLIYDSSGQERFRSMVLSSLKHVHGTILVFDFTNKKSFENLNNWLNDIKDNYINTIIALFGNKNDIEKEKWQVTSEEAKEFAKKNNLPYFETSAKTNQGINEGFSYIINEAYQNIEEKMNNNKIALRDDEHICDNTNCVRKKRRNHS